MDCKYLTCNRTKIKLSKTQEGDIKVIKQEHIIKGKSFIMVGESTKHDLVSGMQNLQMTSVLLVTGQNHKHKLKTMVFNKDR